MIMRNSELLTTGNVILEKTADSMYRVIVKRNGKTRNCFWFDSLILANEQFESFPRVATIPSNSQAELNWAPINQLRLVK